MNCFEGGMWCRGQCMYVLSGYIIVYLYYVTSYDRQGQRYSEREMILQPVAGVTVFKSS